MQKSKIKYIFTINIVTIILMTCLCGCDNDSSTQILQTEDTIVQSTGEATELKHTTLEQQPTTVTSETTLMTTETTETTEAEDERPYYPLASMLPDRFKFNKNQKIVYSVMLEAVSECISPIKMPCRITYEELQEVYNTLRDNSYMYTHIPITGKTFVNPNDQNNIISVEIEYMDSKSQLHNNINALQNKVDLILSGIDSKASQYDKVKYFHDTLIKDCAYDMDAKYAWSAYGALVEGKAVCEGYSKAMALLCNSAGIECILVSGSGDGVPHMWNCVKIDGDWYHIDTTWDDPSMTDADNATLDSIPKYNYFCLTSAQIREDHVIDNNNSYDIPVCTATQANYYIHSNSYIKTYDEAYDMFLSKTEEALKNKQYMITLRASTQTLFNDIKHKYFDERYIFEILTQAKENTGISFNNLSVKKNVNDKLYILTFFIDY